MYLFKQIKVNKIYVFANNLKKFVFLFILLKHSKYIKYRGLCCPNLYIATRIPFVFVLLI